MISYSFLSEYRSGEKQLRLQTCMNRGLVCKAGRMFTYQSKCIYVTKKRLMHFHFENGINNPIPKLSTWNRVKIRIQLHLMIRLCEKKKKTLDIVIECQGQITVKLVTFSCGPFSNDSQIFVWAIRNYAGTCSTKTK